MANKRKQIIPKRGEIYVVRLDPTIGAEIKKTRPALILQNNVANRYSPITIVAAITSKSGEKLYPTEVFVKEPKGGLKTDSVILLNQVRSIDKRRLVKKIGKLEDETMRKVNKALKISLGLVQI